MGSSSDIGGAIGGMIGSMAGYDSARDKRANADANYQRAVDNYNGLLNGGARIDAHSAQAPQQQGDAQSRAAQLAALARLKQMYQSGGLDPQARAELAQAQVAANQNARAHNAAMQSQMAQRGMANSGAQYAAMGQNNRDIGDITGAATQAAGGATDRNMSALGGYATLANNVGQAQDSVNRYNAENQTSNNQFNAGLALNARQNTIQNFLNATAGQNAALQGQAAQYDRRSKQKMDIGTGWGTALGGGGDAAAGMFGGGKGGGSSTPSPDDEEGMV